MRGTWGVWAFVGLSACASGTPVQRPTPSASTSSVSIHQARRGDERVTPYDLNHDGTPDVWDYTVEAPGADGKPVSRRVRQELDMNSDGRADLVKWYGPREQLEKEQLDLNFDGQVDETHFYEGGNLVRLERDTNGDGRVDVWEYYQDGRLDRVGKDLDFDGKVDQWLEGNAASSAARP